MNIPGNCEACGRLVVWNGITWTDPPTADKHDCLVCFALMTRERCMRRRGHRYEHRSAYALENAARTKRSGMAA